MYKYKNIDEILIKRQNNLNNNIPWYEGLTDEEHDIYQSYYSKQRRDKPDIKEAERIYRTEKITCECGCIVARGAYSKHVKTTKHSHMLENKKLLSKDQLTKLNETLEAQKKAKQERMQNNLVQQFKRIDMKRLEELKKDKM